MAGKVIYQEHHPDRESFPDYTIRIRRWVHLFIRRLEQMNSTPENLNELRDIVVCINWIASRMNKDITGALSNAETTSVQAKKWKKGTRNDNTNKQVGRRRKGK